MIRLQTIEPLEISERRELPLEQVERELRLANQMMQAHSMRISVIEDARENWRRVTRVGLGPLSAACGDFWQYSFQIDDDWEKYSVIVKAELDKETLNPRFASQDSLLLRVDSGCETGQLFGDLTCDCKDQLLFALQQINRSGEGMVINIPRQDGRGMGIAFKLATLYLQESLGVDTVESASMLSSNGVIDTRTYSGVVCILQFLGITNECRVKLLTNNPEKQNVFFENGYRVGCVEPIRIKPNRHTERHLRAKHKHLGHSLFD